MCVSHSVQRFSWGQPVVQALIWCGGCCFFPNAVADEGIRVCICRAVIFSAGSAHMYGRLGLQYSLIRKSRWSCSLWRSRMCSLSFVHIWSRIWSRNLMWNTCFTVSAQPLRPNIALFDSEPAAGVKRFKCSVLSSHKRLFELLNEEHGHFNTDHFSFLNWHAVFDSSPSVSGMSCPWSGLAHLPDDNHSEFSPVVWYYCTFYSPSLTDWSVHQVTQSRWLSVSMQLLEANLQSAAKMKMSVFPSGPINYQLIIAMIHFDWLHVLWKCVWSLKSPSWSVMLDLVALLMLAINQNWHNVWLLTSNTWQPQLLWHC